jgi:DNA-binding response OmpR family regulator
MRNTMRSVLRTFGIRSVVDASSMEDAWMTYLSTQPDIMMLAWSPSYDGLKLLRRIRRDDESPSPDLPVIITSSLTEPRHVITARDSGSTDFIAMPYSPKLIYERLCVVIDHPRPMIRSEHFCGPDRRRRSISVDEDRRKKKET